MGGQGYDKDQLEEVIVQYSAVLFGVQCYFVVPLHSVLPKGAAHKAVIDGESVANAKVLAVTLPKKSKPYCLAGPAV